MEDRWLKRLRKKAKRGDRGWPVATVAYYGFDDVRACKVVAAIVRHDGADAEPLKTWFSETGDVRSEPAINQAIIEFIAEHGALSVAMASRLMGCPHEEDVDYTGQWCPDPRCAYWFRRDRFTRKLVDG